MSLHIICGEGIEGLWAGSFVGHKYLRLDGQTLFFDHTRFTSDRTIATHLTYPILNLQKT